MNLYYIDDSIKKSPATTELFLAYYTTATISTEHVENFRQSINLQELLP